MKEKLKRFTKRISICRGEEPKTCKPKQIKGAGYGYAKSKRGADEMFAEKVKTRHAQILNIREQRTMADVI